MYKKILAVACITAAVFFLIPYKSYASFTYSRSITVATGKVPSTQTNFPMAVSGTYSYLATVANGGKVQNANGYDVGFYSNSNCATGKLNWETETYSATTGTVNYWVNVASMLDGAIIYMCYGDSSISTDQSNATAVWDSNYKGVWHVPDGTTLTANDSLGASNGTITGATAATGKIDGGGSFSGTSQYINVGNTSNLQGLTGNITIEAWVKPTDFANYNGIIGKTGGAGNNYPRPFDFYSIITTGKLTIFQGGAGDVYDSWNSTTALTSGVWTHVVGQMQNSGTASRAGFFYLNGVADTAVAGLNATFTTSDGGGSAYIASRADLVTMFKGSMDEIRVSNILRSANWITTEYNNQSSPSTFYTVGAEQSLITSSGTGTFTIKSGTFTIKSGTFYP